MAAPIKMDELLVSWLGSDEVYDNVMALIEKYRVQSEVKQGEEKDFDADSTTTIEGGDTTAVTANIGGDRSNGGRQQQHGGVVAQRTTTEACGSLTSSSGHGSEEVGSNNTSHAAAVIPPFHPLKTPTGTTIQRRRRLPRQSESWEPLPESKDNDLATRSTAAASTTSSFGNKTNLNAAKPSRMKINSNGEVASLSGPGGDGRTPASLEDLEEQQLQLQQEEAVVKLCVRDQLMNLLRELHLLPPLPFDIDDDHGRSDLPPLSEITIPPEAFLRICKEVFLFPTFFHQPLYQRILDLWNKRHDIQAQQRLNMSMLEWYWKLEMEPYDPPERFFRLVKQPNNDCILRDDFLPFIKALLNDHPVRMIRMHDTFFLLFDYFTAVCYVSNFVFVFLLFRRKSGFGILIQPCRIPREICCDCDYTDLLFGQQMPFRTYHVTSSPTVGSSRRFQYGRRGRRYQQGH
jgi:hypothetical protein